MSELSKKMMARKQPRPKKAPPDEQPLTPEQQKALNILQQEAKRADSMLTSDGKGGLDPRLVLGAMRRDQYECQECGETGNDSNGGIGVHHLGGIVDSKKASRMGHKNILENIQTICDDCHDREHAEARAKGQDSSQVLPSGDRGDPRRDHGQPKAKVDK